MFLGVVVTHDSLPNNHRIYVRTGPVYSYSATRITELGLSSSTTHTQSCQLSHIEWETPAFGALLPPTRIWHQISRILTIGGCDQNDGRACSVHSTVPVPYSFSTCMCTYILDILISISMCQPLSSSGSFITYLVKMHVPTEKEESVRSGKGEGLAN